MLTATTINLYLVFSLLYLSAFGQHGDGHSGKMNTPDHNGGFDHRAHSVPGVDQVVYDLDDDGQEMIHLDGIGSHSHYFDAGPPVKSGVIVDYNWAEVATGTSFCFEQVCDLPFPVGKTEISLTVTDNTGDVASDVMLVTILPRSSITELPRIESLSPNEGQSSGGNKITIDGAYLYRDSKVYFGTTEATEVEQIDLTRITCIAPGGTGTVSVIVESSIGVSNALQYTYQEGSDVPIRFLFDTWKNPDNSEYSIEEITSITIGWDHRYYMGSLLGTVTVATVSRELIVEASCTGAYMGADRSITGIAYNPLDTQKRVLVSTNTHFHKSKGVRWDNAKIEAVVLDTNGCPVRGNTIVSGLPVSNHDHGTNSIAFMNDGRMLISVGSFSNAGASKPDDGIGGVPENPLSGSIVVADYLAVDFDGTIVYDQYEDPGTSLLVSGDVRPYAIGIRNSFGIVAHSNGKVYATDNGPNTGFGLKSVSCTKDGPDPESGDKLLRILDGMYYGHPNRNRGRFDPRQCAFRYIDEPSADGYMMAIGTMTSSTNGIMEYRSNKFNAALKGDLLMSKVAFGADGMVYRAELTEDGNLLKGKPYEFYDQSGVSITMGLYGELVMPQLKKYRVIALRPDESGASSVSIIAVQPRRGPKEGGTEIIITGHYLNSPDLVVMVGDAPCVSLENFSYQHVTCITPPGTGKVSVVASAGGSSSKSYGHEYEYL